MKRIIILSITISFILAGCGTKFLLTAEGESFDSLTKITQGDKDAFHPDGGANNENLVFVMSEKGSEGYTNIYMKDNVLSQAVIQKTAGLNWNRSPRYCKANNKIVFEYWDKTNGNYDIYYVDASKGKAITQITNTDGNEGNPNWSPDGKIIVFEKGAFPKGYISYTQNQRKTISMQTIRITENQIWTKNIETGELKMIGEGSFPSVSPDGKQIAFVKYDLNKRKNDQSGSIWIMGLEGGSPKQLTNSNLGDAKCPAWSPDGLNLVFELEKPGSKQPDIYSITTDGDNIKQHTTNKSYDFTPRWSEDNYIYFTSDRGGKKGDFQIFRFKYSE